MLRSLGFQSGKRDTNGPLYINGLNNIRRCRGNSAVIYAAVSNAGCFSFRRITDSSTEWIQIDSPEDRLPYVVVQVFVA